MENQNSKLSGKKRKFNDVFNNNIDLIENICEDIEVENHLKDPPNRRHPIIPPKKKKKDSDDEDIPPTITFILFDGNNNLKIPNN